MQKRISIIKYLTRKKPLKGPKNPKKEEKGPKTTKKKKKQTKVRKSKNQASTKDEKKQGRELEIPKEKRSTARQQHAIGLEFCEESEKKQAKELDIPYTLESGPQHGSMQGGSEVRHTYWPPTSLGVRMFAETPLVVRDSQREQQEQAIMKRIREKAEAQSMSSGRMEKKFEQSEK